MMQRLLWVKQAVIKILLEGLFQSFEIDFLIELKCKETHHLHKIHAWCTRVSLIHLVHCTCDVVHSTWPALTNWGARCKNMLSAFFFLWILSLSHRMFAIRQTCAIYQSFILQHLWFIWSFILRKKYSYADQESLRPKCHITCSCTEPLRPVSDRTSFEYVT